MTIQVAALLLAACSISLLPPLQASASGSKVHYVGGTGANLEKSQGRIELGSEDALVFTSKSGEVRVPYRDINTIEYGQHVGRHYLEAMLISPFFILAKKKSHFVTVGYMSSEGHQEAMIFKVEASDVRTLLVMLEARTGRRVDYQDDEARKEGKG